MFSSPSTTFVHVPLSKTFNPQICSVPSSTRLTVFWAAHRCESMFFCSVIHLYTLAYGSWPVQPQPAVRVSHWAAVGYKKTNPTHICSQTYLKVLHRTPTFPQPALSAPILFLHALYFDNSPAADSPSDSTTGASEASRPHCVLKVSSLEKFFASFSTSEIVDWIENVLLRMQRSVYLWVSLADRRCCDEEAFPSGATKGKLVPKYCFVTYRIVYL